MIWPPETQGSPQTWRPHEPRFRRQQHNFDPAIPVPSSMLPICHQHCVDIISGQASVFLLGDSATNVQPSTRTRTKKEEPSEPPQQ
ncbi:uncharacterized protein ANIA_10726 [Aspergillus nidulans FGSC A4]|uniref:Uncharacterized protein n=1 Tax=Emericella nidulans (strain FGSC A4 / ATCC 38163 / CBS 112.46 / NRRL 194 / M139) TaxID=227321 RepID=C8VFI2_EMENI|nr:hypothetical protein [Aspergillus nidulans FGSC A4]CBF81267.1 TPA: hypothetical protein ANIA_10726 [Aspergillus nidulans FGSC A4]